MGEIERPSGIIGRFPPSFTLGTATAAYQIEGAVTEDRRGPSIWDTFSHTLGRVVNGETGDIACDHYHRWPEDLDLLADLGVDAYRLSIAWPRISAIAGYAQGRHAPGAREWHGALAAAHHLLLAHGLAVAALRPYGRPVGVTLNLSPVVPLSTSDADGLAACRADLVHNRLFLDPLLRGAYPDDYDAVLGSLTDRCAGGAGSDDAGLTDRARGPVRHAGRPPRHVPRASPDLHHRERLRLSGRRGGAGRRTDRLHGRPPRRAAPGPDRWRRRTRVFLLASARQLRVGLAATTLGSDWCTWTTRPRSVRARPVTAGCGASLRRNRSLNIGGNRRYGHDHSARRRTVFGSGRRVDASQAG